MNMDLKIIKKHYGERMMRLCRTLFPTILEKEGFLSDLLLKKFNPSKFLYEDIVNTNSVENFKNYIYSQLNSEILDNEEKTTTKTPKELLEEAGYDLYECKTEEEIQSFRKYYKEGEELCTFDGGRLERCHVFFVVKKDVENINRKDFPIPRRDDLYGTSVMSIQFTRGKNNTLSIKNRYNHRVENPDATLSNNLENIIPGLTKSFEREYNLKINRTETSGFELPKYVRANDGKYYKYNYEINNVYYCPNNIIIDNFEVKKINSQEYLVLDYFILDLKRKTIINYQDSIGDCFTDGIKNIKKISILKEGNNKKITILTETNNEIIIRIDKQNRIIEYKNNGLEKVGNNFLKYNSTLSNLEMPKVKEFGNDCLTRNSLLKTISLPELEKVGSDFLRFNRKIKIVNFPKLKEVADSFMARNEELETISLPELEKAGSKFLLANRRLKEVNFPKLKEVADRFLACNEELETISLPELEKVGEDFLNACVKLRSVNFPKLKEVADRFMQWNEELETISLPELEKVGSDFLRLNKKIRSVNFPKLKEVGDSFMEWNEELEIISLPELETIGSNFLTENKKIKTVNFPKLGINKSNPLYGDKYSLYDYKISAVKKVYIENLLRMHKKTEQSSLGGNHKK